MIADKTLLFTPVSISEVIDTGVNSNDKTSLTKIKGELIYE